MLDLLKARLKQGYRTAAFPAAPLAMPERFRGQPSIGRQKCEGGCTKCIDACPVDAVSKTDERIILDLGRCIFCGACEELCSHGNIKFTDDYRLSVRRRKDLVMNGSALKLAEKLEPEMKRLFGRSLKLRQVSAGGCSACEADTNVLNTLAWDLGRFGIQFVASPRHADGILVTGPVTANMKEALQKTYDAVAEPKIVIAVGACAVSGGLYADSSEVPAVLDTIVPVDLYIPGCPPHPSSILDGLLRLLGRMKRDPRESVRETGDAQKKLIRNVIKS